MVPTFILLFVLVNCGETFYRPPPPQLIEYPGFISALKSMFGFEKSQDGQDYERTELHQQSEQLVAYCAAYAKVYDMPWFEKPCLDSFLLHKTPNIHRHVYDYGFY